MRVPTPIYTVWLVVDAAYQEKIWEMAVEGHRRARSSEHWYDEGDLVDNEDALVRMVRSFSHDSGESRIQRPHTGADDMKLAEDVAREKIA